MLLVALHVRVVLFTHNLVDVFPDLIGQQSSELGLNLVLQGESIRNLIWIVAFVN